MDDYIGSPFGEFLKEENILVDVETLAIKRVLIKLIKDYLRENKLAKTAFAKQMKINSAQMDKLLDPENAHLSLKTLVSLANAMGKRVEINFN